MASKASGESQWDVIGTLRRRNRRSRQQFVNLNRCKISNSRNAYALPNVSFKTLREAGYSCELGEDGHARALKPLN